MCIDPDTHVDKFKQGDRQVKARCIGPVRGSGECEREKPDPTLVEKWVEGPNLDRSSGQRFGGILGLRDFNNSCCNSGGGTDGRKYDPC